MHNKQRYGRETDAGYRAGWGKAKEKAETKRRKHLCKV